VGEGELIRKQVGRPRNLTPDEEYEQARINLGSLGLILPPKEQQMSAPLVPAIVQPGAGQTLRAFGEEVIIRLSGAETQGRLTLWTEITPPGGGPPPHYHEREDEWFIVEEGRVGFFANGAWQELGPGGTVFMPRGLVHTFKNMGDAPSRMTISTSPSGFEIFFARCHEEFGKPGPPDMARITAISAEHGIHFVQDCATSA
jgi:quercetin dioxygenase-like cupin family protein